MSVSEFAIVAARVRGMAHNYYLHVLGEPLLHPEIETIQKICDDNGMAVTLATNGTTLNASKELICRHPGVRYINISLHSHKQNGGTEAGFDGFCDEVLGAVEYILSRSAVAVSLRLWDNEVAARLQKTGYTRLSERLNLSVEEEFDWPARANGNPDGKAFCLGLKSHVAILSDGSVVPCCLDANGDTILGNIFMQSLTGCIEGGRAKAIRAGFSRLEAVEPLCAKCTYRKRFYR